MLLTSLGLMIGLRILGAGKWLYFPAFEAPHMDFLQAAGLTVLCLTCGYPFLLEAGSRILETGKQGAVTFHIQDGRVIYGGYKAVYIENSP